MDGKSGFLCDFTPMRHAFPIRCARRTISTQPTAETTPGDGMAILAASSQTEARERARLALIETDNAWIDGRARKV